MIRNPFTVILAVPSSVAVDYGEFYLAWVYGHGKSLPVQREQAIREARENFADEYGLTVETCRLVSAVLVLSGHHRDCLDSGRK